jgi:hypothetical protein
VRHCTVFPRAADLGAAERTAAEARRIGDGLGSPLVAACDVLLARVRRALGDAGAAALLAHRGLEPLVDDDVRPEIPDALEVLGGLALDSGNPQTASACSSRGGRRTPR